MRRSLAIAFTLLILVATLSCVRKASTYAELQTCRYKLSPSEYANIYIGPLLNSIAKIDRTIPRANFLGRENESFTEDTNSYFLDCRKDPCTLFPQINSFEVSTEFDPLNIHLEGDYDGSATFTLEIRFEVKGAVIEDDDSVTVYPSHWSEQDIKEYNE